MYQMSGAQNKAYRFVQDITISTFINLFHYLLWDRITSFFLTIICRTIWNWWMIWLLLDLLFFAVFLGCITEFMPGKVIFSIVDAITNQWTRHVHYIVVWFSLSSITNAVKTSGGLKERLFNAAYNAKKQAILNGKVKYNLIDEKWSSLYSAAVKQRSIYSEISIALSMALFQAR